MTYDLDDLIEHVVARGPEATAVAGALVRRGDDFIEAVLRRAADELLPAPPAILDLVAWAATPHTTPRLLAALDDASYPVAFSAYLALGHLAEPRGLAAIAARLVGDDGHIDAHPAASALILAGAPGVAPILRTRLLPWLEARDGVEALGARAIAEGAGLLSWPVAIAVAAAASGDACGAPLVYAIARLSAEALDAVPEGLSAHASWTLDLGHFAEPGLLAAIDAAVQVSAESAELAARVLGGLGTHQAIARLVALTAHHEAAVERAAAHWLGAVIAPGLPAKPRATFARRAARWWDDHGPALDLATSYAAGKPRRIEPLFDALGDLYDEADEDLARTLGLRIGPFARSRGLSRRAAIDHLRAHATAHFATGSLYRYGAAADPTML